MKALSKNLINVAIFIVPTLVMVHNQAEVSDLLAELGHADPHFSFYTWLKVQVFLFSLVAVAVLNVSWLKEHFLLALAGSLPLILVPFNSDPKIAWGISLDFSPTVFFWAMLPFCIIAVSKLPDDSRLWLGFAAIAQLIFQIIEVFFPDAWNSQFLQQIWHLDFFADKVAYLHFGAQPGGTGALFNSNLAGHFAATVATFCFFRAVVEPNPSFWRVLLAVSFSSMLMSLSKSCLILAVFCIGLGLIWKIRNPIFLRKSIPGIIICIVLWVLASTSSRLNVFQSLKSGLQEPYATRTELSENDLSFGSVFEDHATITFKDCVLHIVLEKDGILFRDSHSRPLSYQISSGRITFDKDCLQDVHGELRDDRYGKSIVFSNNDYPLQPLYIVNDQFWILHGQRLAKVVDTNQFMTWLPDSIFSHRGEIWKKSLILLPQCLWLGCGVGSFATVYPANINSRAFKGNLVDRPHQGFLLMLFELGIVTTLVYLGGCFHILLLSFYRQDENALPFLASAACYLSCALFNDAYIGTLTFFCWILGRLLRRIATSSSE